MIVFEKVGVIFFFGKVGCVFCYNGLVLNSMIFYGVGMVDLDQCGEEVFKIIVEEFVYFG